MAKPNKPAAPPAMYLFGMLAAIWTITLLMCWRQAELCEKRSAGAAGKCSMEWQLAIVTSLGMGQSLLGIWTNSPNAPQPLPAVRQLAAKVLRDERSGGPPQP